MKLEFLKEQRTALMYDDSQLPHANITRFFESVKLMRYFWVEWKEEGKTNYYLDSAWQNEVGLKSITSDFVEQINQHLLRLSMDEKTADEYSTILKDCKILLQKINHYYRPSFTDILILTVPENPIDFELIVEYDSLPEDLKIRISRCYELFIVFFHSLRDIITEEQEELSNRQHVKTGSSYEWIDDKNDFSELALAIFASGAVKRKGTKKMMPSTFARELAAFFGIENLRFDQDIDLIGTRTKRRKGQFIDTCKESLLKIFQEKNEKQ